MRPRPLHVTDTLNIDNRKNRKFVFDMFRRRKKDGFGRGIE